MKKIILLILDGLGDRPVSELGDKTPLEAAGTPNLDWMALRGRCGLVETFQFPGEKEPTSEGTHVALFGYKDYFLGRGPYEAAGEKIKMKEGDIALRVNFATVDKSGEILDRRAGRIENTKGLAEDLSGKEIDGVKFILKKAYGHRGVLIMRGKGLSPDITDGDPHQVGMEPNKIKAKENKKEAQFTSKILNKFLDYSYQVLEEHPQNRKRRTEGLLPANYLLVRGAGEFKLVPSFKEKYNLSSACIAGGTLYKGVGNILGMDLIEVEGDTGLANTNLKGKISTALSKAKEYDFVFCHIKPTDTYSHDGDFQGKKNFIEKIDKTLASLKDLKNTLVVVTSDHSSPCEVKGHSSDPTPLLIWGGGKSKNSIGKFSEKECQKGDLNITEQTKLMEKIINIASE